MKANNCFSGMKRLPPPGTAALERHSSPPASAFSHEVTVATATSAHADSPDRTATQDTGQRLTVTPSPIQIALWSEDLVELVLRQLSLSDLARCSRVCRRWHQIASRPGLQAHCFVQSYPEPYRQQLADSLDRNRTPQYLAPWYESLAPDEQQRTQLATSMAWSASQSLLFTLTRQRVCTETFAGPAPTHLRCGAQLVHRLLSTPDSRYLATANWLLSPDQPLQLTLWQCEPAAINWHQTFHHTDGFLHLAFSANSRSLLGVDFSGRVCKWQRDEKDRWHKLPPSELHVPNIVRTVVASADNRILAVLSTGLKVSVFQESPAGDWHKHWLWDLHSPENIRFIVRGWARLDGPCQLLLGDQGRCLLMASQQRVQAAHQVRGTWQEQRIEQEAAPLHDSSAPCTSIVMASHGRLFAATFWLGWNRTMGVNSGQFVLKIWQRETSSGWEQKRTHVFHTLAHRWQSFPTAMALSPDNHHLAIVENTTMSQEVRILSPGNTQMATLPSRFGTQPNHRTQVLRLQFNATGQYLAATACLGVQIWQHHPVSGWISVTWIASAGDNLCRLIFSPDGYHCALSTGSGVSVWGHTKDGGYREKLQAHPDAAVDQLLFTPDGTQLVLVLNVRDGAMASRWLHSLPLVPARHVRQDETRASP
ncbi:MAG: F-box protein [Kistimonas sp.]|nr:F-box protein [Kistimonas sp.]